MARTPKADGFTLRTYLLAILAVILVGLSLASWVVWRSDVERALGEAEDRAALKAEMAATALTDSLDELRMTTESVRAQPEFLDAFTTGESCSFEGFEGIGVFVSARFDVLRDGGLISCRTDPDMPFDAGQARSSLEALLADRDETIVGPVTDPATGRTSFIAAARLPERAGGADAIVAVGHADDASRGLAATLSDAEGVSFTVLDGAVVVSSPSPDGDPGTSPGTRDRGTWIDADGVTRIHGSAAVPNLGWRVVAGIDRHVVQAEVDARAFAQLRLWGMALAAVLLAAFAINRRIVRSLRKVTLGALAARDEAVPAQVRITGPTEVRQLARAFNDMITARLDYEARITHQALHDGLTGLPNRILLADRLGHALARIGRGEDRIAVLFVDLDNFKLVNDSLGHQAGDRVLLTVSDRIRTATRPSDTVARFGGDEFVIVAEGIGREDAVVLAERVGTLLARPVTVNGHQVTVTASIGIAVADRPGNTADDLLREADAAMYHAKDAGPARHEVFDETLRSRAAARLALEADLRSALRRGELAVHFQPRLDLTTGDITGAEALVRWEHPVRGWVSPIDFIPVAEETDLIVPIGDHVLDEGCRQAAAWARQGTPLVVSVNVSSRQLVHTEFAQTVRHALFRYSLDPSLLAIELTESNLVDSGPMVDTLEAVRELGVRVSIDDFGTGYSSLSYLRRLPVDELKVDRSFIAATETDPEARTVLEAVAAMGRALGLTVVAEGVETVEQLELVRQAGCDAVQGYLIAKPAPAGELRLGQPVTASAVTA